MDFQFLIILCFIAGYSAIVFEQKTGIHKSASALIVLRLFEPSLLSLIIPLLFSTFRIRDEEIYLMKQPKEEIVTTTFERRLVFYSGISAFFSIPLFSHYGHLRYPCRCSCIYSTIHDD